MKESNLDYEIDALESTIQFEYKRVIALEHDAANALIEIGKMENKLDELYLERISKNADKVQT